MSALAALALVGEAAPAASAQAVSSAMKAYQEACIEGSLKLSPSRGRILKPDEPYNFLDYLAWGQSIASRTIVKLADKPISYLILIEYKQLQPKSVARTCTLDSNSVSKREAMGAFLEGLPDKDVSPQWVPDMYLPVWTSDHPELGFRKLLRFRDDGSIVLEIGIYPTAAQLNSGTTKQ